MARRVNTRFVIILGSILCLGAIAVLWVFTRSWLQGRDPVFLKKKGKEAEDAGKLTDALKFYGLAALFSGKQHTADAAEVYLKSGDIAMQLSASEPDPTKAENYYKEALVQWEAALNQNFRFLPAHEKILEEWHKEAKNDGSQSGYWQGVQDEATKLIEVDKTYAPAYIYRAEAGFIVLSKLEGSGSVASHLKDVESDIKQAMTLAPDESEPVILQSMAYEFEAGQATSRGLSKDAAKLQDAAMATLRAFLVKHPNNPDVSISLAQAVGKSKHVDQEMKIVEDAYAANPKSEVLAEAMASFYRYNKKPDQAEKILKDIIAADPANTDGYRRLAYFYTEAQEYDKAIEAYKMTLDHLQPGGGILAINRNRDQMEALYEICWLNMEKADRVDASSTAGKAAIAEAAAFLERYRGNPQTRAMLSLLDGRLNFLRGNIPGAIADLHNADVAFSLGNTRLPEWSQTKMLLAGCYERQADWGTAIGFYEQILKVQPGLISAILKRAMVYNRVGRFSEAEDSVKKLLDSPLPENVRNLAMSIDAKALAGMGKMTESVAVLQGIKSPTAQLEIARNMATDGNFAGALNVVTAVINDAAADSDPAINASAYEMAIRFNIRLDHMDVAQKLLDAAIAKSPTDTKLQSMQAVMKLKSTDPEETQIKILESIPDDYTRYTFLAEFYRQKGDHVKELDSLQQAEAKLGDTDATRENYAIIVESVFNLSLDMANTAATPADKKKYFDIAEKCVAIADRDNLDGVNGKLFQGRLEFLRDDQQKGLLTLKQAVAERPDYSAGHTVLGRAYMDLHEAEPALEEFRQAIAQNPNNLTALRAAITIIYKKMDANQLPEAQKFLKQAYLLAPNDSQLKAFNDVLGDPAEAIQQREKVRRETPVKYQGDPQYEDNTRRLAMLYARTEQPGKAIELLRPLYDKMPDDQNTDKDMEKLQLADVLARLYRDTKQTNVALDMYEHFIASKDKTVQMQAILYLGDMQHQMGEDDQAKKTYGEAISMESGDDDQGERRLADLYFELDDMPNAEVNYQKIYDRAAVKDNRVLRRLAESLIRQGKYAASDSLLSTLFQKDPTDPEGLVLQGFSLFRQNRQKEAIANFDKILNDPAIVSSNEHFRTDALYYRAFARYQMGQDLDLAVKDLLQVRDIQVRDQQPVNINAGLLLARIYQASYHYAEAVGEYKDIIASKPDLVGARVEYSRLLFTLAQIEKQMPPDSQDEIGYVLRSVHPTDTLKTFLEETQKIYPDQMQWKVLYGDLDTLYGNYAEAQAYYAEAFNKSGGNPVPAAAYLKSLLQSKSYDDVIAVSTNLIKAQPDVASYFIDRAAAYAGKKNLDEASADIIRALNLSTADSTTIPEIARQAVPILGVDKVVSILQDRFKANSTDVGTRMAYGQTLLLANRPADAVPILEPVYKDSTLTEPVKKFALRVLALAKYQAKDFPGAMANYNEILKDNPDDIESLNNMAFMLADDLKRPKDGLVYADHAEKILNRGGGSLTLLNNGNVLDTYGWVLYLSGDTSGAIPQLVRAMQIDPMPVGYLHLATAYQKAGRKDEAAKAVDDGIKLAIDANDPALAGLQAMQKSLAVR